MRFVFRADASQAIGAGHVMRSTAIAEEVIARGLSAIFVGEITGMPWLSERVNSLGFIEVISETKNFFPNVETDILIVDSYEISIDDQFIQPNKWWSVVSIVDSITPNYQSQIRIYPGIESNSVMLPNVYILSGPKYIPLRKSITRIKEVPRNKRLEIVVTGGGSDAQEFVTEVAEILSKIDGDFHVTLVTNNEITFALDKKFIRLPIGSNFDSFTNSAELVFSTASTTSLEFIARGCTVAVGCSVSNQEFLYEKLASSGIAIPIGKLESNGWQLDSKKIAELIFSSQTREKIRLNALSYIDLQGASRIVDEVIQLSKVEKS